MLPDRVALFERVALAASRIGAVPPPLPFFDAHLGLMAARALMAATSLGVFAGVASSGSRKCRSYRAFRGPRLTRS